MATGAGLVVMLLSAPSAAGAQDGDADLLPPGEGRAVVVARCGLCHSVQYAAAPGKQSAEFWRETVEDMYYQAGWGQDDDQKVIIDYLVGAFGTAEPPAGGAPAASATPAAAAAAAAQPTPAPAGQGGTRILLGTIVDQRDRPVRGARVTVTQILGTSSQSTVATADFFRIEELVPGVYEVRVDAEGFAPWVGVADVRTLDVASLQARLQAVGPAEPLRRYRPVTEAMALNPPPEDWLHFRRTYDHQAYSPLTQINRKNVQQLTLAWSWRVHPGAFEGTPQVHDGVMFVANPNGGVQALDAATGDLLWDFQIPITEVKGPGSGEDDRGSEATPTGGILNAVGPSRPVRNVGLWGDKVYTATTRYDGGRLIALDARTGKVVWERRTEVSPDGTATGDHSAGPIVVKGKVMLGSTNCERYTQRRPPCWIAAFDAETGKDVWRTSTIQMPGDPGPDTWGGVPALQRAGADNWQAGSYDPKTNFTYWGTAQAKPWVRFQRGHDGAALYSSSTLALDADSGKMAWYYQHIPGESFNMDETFERVLVDYDGKSSSFSMGKIGILWELDRQTGAFRAAHDLGYQDQGTIDPKTGQLTYLPHRVAQRDTSITFCPGVAGVKSGKAMAYHPETMAMYIPLFPHCQERTFVMPDYKPVEGDGGTGEEGGASRDRFHPKSPEHLGDFVAQDIRTGKILWRHRTRTPPTTSAITTAGGLVVVADWDRYMRIYDVKDGKILYQVRLPSPGSGSPSTFMVNGRQHIAMPFGTGSGGSWDTIPRNLAPEVRTQSWDEHLTGIFVFALPDRR